MSRHEIEPDEKHRHCRIVCGWDAALGNFFLQVEDTRADEISDARMVQWLGADGVKTLANVDSMLAVLNRYGQAPDGLRDKLLRDREAQPFRDRLGHGFVQETSRGGRQTEEPKKSLKERVAAAFKKGRQQRQRLRNMDDPGRER